MGRIFPHVLAYPDENAEKSRKGGGGEGGGEELSRIEHAAKQQLKTKGLKNSWGGSEVGFYNRGNYFIILKDDGAICGRKQLGTIRLN